MIVFVGVDPAALRSWRAGNGYSGPGVAATAAMLAAHGYGPKDTEDAEFAALGYASVLSALRPDADPARRWVAAVELPEAAVRSSDEDPAHGVVEVADAGWPRIQALFVDEPEAAAAVAALVTLVEGRPVVEVLSDDAVLDVVDELDLLWHVPDELEALLDV